MAATLPNITQHSIDLFHGKSMHDMHRFAMGSDRGGVYLAHGQHPGKAPGRPSLGGYRW